MMESVKRIDGTKTNPVDGNVVYDYSKMSWNLGMIIATVIFVPVTITIESVSLFIILTYSTLLIGHSVGLHRMMIHTTYECPKTIERILVYIGVLVGMSGPFGIIKIHDIRDWAQRQRKCHDFFSHKKPYFIDLWWQLTSKFEFNLKPIITIESKFFDDPFYQFLEKTWRYHQLVFALILYAIGGWSYVVWGIFVRVSISVIGHWTITYFCHNPGPGKWRVKGACVQASNLPGLGFITYGECWHNNHHAFPESAQIGLEAGQLDPGWKVIQLMRFFGLVSNIQLPRSNKYQSDLVCVDNDHQIIETS